MDKREKYLWEDLKKTIHKSVLIYSNVYYLSPEDRASKVVERNEVILNTLKYIFDLMLEMEDRIDG